jgi:hypothetical protein
MLHALALQTPRLHSPFGQISLGDRENLISNSPPLAYLKTPMGGLSYYLFFTGPRAESRHGRDAVERGIDNDVNVQMSALTVDARVGDLSKELMQTCFHKAKIIFS